MPKKPKTPTPPAYIRPPVFPVYVYEPLSLDERKALRAILASDVFKKALQNAHAKKPGVHVEGTGVFKVTELSPMLANNRLHQLQGWEMFEAALFMQAEETMPRQAVQIQEQYQPD
jgi:hypothetical protein